MNLHISPPSPLPAEAAHPRAFIEWWFVQGYFAGGDTGRRHFMASFFRQAVTKSKPQPQHGHMLLLSALDPATGRQEVISRVDPTLVDFYTRFSARAGKANLEKQVLQAYRRELADYGLPQPIYQDSSQVALTSSPWGVTWDDFRLSQRDDGFDFEFREPGSRRRCRCRLRPAHSRIHMENITLGRAGSMDLVTYPRLELNGKVGDEAVQGEAWLDHQWGDLHWFVTGGETGRILGWDWFGINLDNGDDLLLFTHRDGRTRRPVLRYGVHLRDGRQGTLIRDFKVIPRKWWESGKTHIRYPVSWRLLIPQLEADLIFEPSAPDQEIPVLGVIRSVWEGAGMVRGKLGGQELAGRARLELHGYGYVFDLKNQWQRLVTRLDRQIEDYFPKVLRQTHLPRYLGNTPWRDDPRAYTEMLSRPAWDLMARRGKHWRVISGILLLEALGVDSGPYEMLGAVVSELPHTGSLIIDDIQDRSQMRRGGPSIHQRYGLDVAINSGNALYFLPYLLVQTYPRLSAAQRYETCRIINQNFVRAHFGQGLDIYWSQNMSPKNLGAWSHNSLKAKILQSYALKTASPMVGLAEAACVIAAADDAVRQACVAFAWRFGVAFQIIDDVLNFTDPRRTGDQRGEDLAIGKLTYVIFQAWQRLAGEPRKRLEAILCSGTAAVDAGARQEGIELIRASGALTACRREAGRMLARGWRQLSAQVPPSESKTLLRLLCSSLIDLPDERPSC
jgi:geranylgeranyl pyrophosphate synthase